MLRISGTSHCNLFNPVRNAYGPSFLGGRDPAACGISNPNFPEVLVCSSYSRGGGTQRTEKKAGFRALALFSCAVLPLACICLGMNCSLLLIAVPAALRQVLKIHASLCLLLCWPHRCRCAAYACREKNAQLPLCEISLLTSASLRGGRDDAPDQSNPSTSWHEGIGSEPPRYREAIE